MNPNKRITCKEALNHTYFSESHFPKAYEPYEYKIKILKLIKFSKFLD